MCARNTSTLRPSLYLHRHVDRHVCPACAELMHACVPRACFPVAGHPCLVPAHADVPYTRACVDETHLHTDTHRRVSSDPAFPSHGMCWERVPTSEPGSEDRTGVSCEHCRQQETRPPHPGYAGCGRAVFTKPSTRGIIGCRQGSGLSYRRLSPRGKAGARRPAQASPVEGAADVPGAVRFPPQFLMTDPSATRARRTAA